MFNRNNEVLLFTLHITIHHCVEQILIFLPIPTGFKLHWYQYEYELSVGGMYCYPYQEEPYYSIATSKM